MNVAAELETEETVRPATPRHFLHLLPPQGAEGLRGEAVGED